MRCVGEVAKVSFYKRVKMGEFLFLDSSKELFKDV